MKLPVAPLLREWNPADTSELNMVRASWLRTYTAASRGVEHSVFETLYRMLLNPILARSTVLVACMPDVPSSLYGWMCWGLGGQLHYVAVKPRWQRLGIASWMLEDFRDHAVEYTHRTPAGVSLDLPASWQYRPMRRFDGVL